MEKLILLVVLILFAVIGEAKSQSWQEMMDSCNVYQEKQDFQTALKWANLVLPQAEKEFGNSDDNYLQTLAVIEELFYSLGQTDSMVHYAEMHLSICRDRYKKDDSALAVSISNLAYYYYITGNFTAAEPLYIEALGMNRRLYKSDHPQLANSIDNMAYFCDFRGNYTEAEKLYKEALEINRRLFKEDNPVLANTINNIAAFYNDRGNFASAEPLFKEALEMVRRLYKQDNPNLANSISNMAAFYSLRGNYSAAEPLFKEALEMLRRLYKGDHPAITDIINNLAYFYNSQGNFAAAEPLYIEALEMRKRLFKSDHPAIAGSLNNLAALYNFTGNYEKAEPLLKEALGINRRIYTQDNPDLASSLNQMAYFYDCVNKYSEAEPLYIESLNMKRRILNDDHPDLAMSINNLAHHYIASGKYAEAEPLIKEALEMYVKIINNYFPSLSENEKSMFWNKYKDNFEGFNTFAIKRMKENPSILCSMFDKQLYTKAILYNSGNKIKKRIFHSNDSVLIRDYNEFLGLRDKLIKMYALTKSELIDKKINIDSLEDKANNLEKRISLKSEEYKQSYENKKITWQTVQMALKPDEACLEIVRFHLYGKTRFTDTVCYAVLIVSDQTTDNPDIILLENGNEIENKNYQEYRKYIKARIPDNASFKAFWEKIYEKTKQYRKIYFVPDGIFNKINVSTFKLPSGNYLLDGQEIQTLNSSKDLLLSFYSNKDESSIYNNAILIGNPNFSSKQTIEAEKDDYVIRQIQFSRAGILKTVKATPLAGTEKEIQNIEKFLKSKKWDVSKFIKNDAVKESVKNAASPRVLHIATHGFFLPDFEPELNKSLYISPLFQSGLFFAGATSNQNGNDSDAGLLTAYEAMNLNLDKTELVVLSACETGLGKVRNGEGVFGLRRAFQQAGAKSVLMSLWGVDDEATQELMSAFYEEWISGKSKREAFNNAQQKIRAEYPEPYYWGAFVMVGE